MAGEDPMCWEVKRERKEEYEYRRDSQESSSFFQETLENKHCKTNWFEGNDGNLGSSHHVDHFGGAVAPALIGFEDNVDELCTNTSCLDCPAEAVGPKCITAGYNIFSLSGKHVPYNMCRTLEWAVCAAQGFLPGQKGKSIKFATAPNTLDPTGASGRGLGQCCGSVPADERLTEGNYAYTPDDKVFMEVCLLSELCSNSDDMFELPVGAPFECDFNAVAFRELQELLLEGEEQPSEPEQCDDPKVCFDLTWFPNGRMRSCNDCYRIHQGQDGDCSVLPGCNNFHCAFCTNYEKEPLGV